MPQPILVAYATKHGATMGIASAIAEELRNVGLEVEVHPVAQVQDPSGYAAVVLGSAVYIGQWRREAVSFLETHATTLAERPVWIYSSGPTGEGDPIELVQGVRIPEKLLPVVDQIKPREITVFHGELDPEELGLGEKLIIKGVKAPTGDFRDWDSIADWASSIGETLKSEAT